MINPVKYTTEQQIQVVKSFYLKQGSIIKTQRTYSGQCFMSDSPSFVDRGSVSDLPRKTMPLSFRKEAVFE